MGRLKKEHANPFNHITHPNVWRGHNYATDVISGKVLACKFIIGACERYLREVKDDYNDNYYFDPDKAEKFLKIVQRFDHVIGKWKSKKIFYEPWQCWVWMNIMGFISRTTGYRRFRTAHVEVARGNGKSAMASTAGLYFLAFDDPQGNQIATAATKKEQARIVLDAARSMARKNPSYLRHTGVEVKAHEIVLAEKDCKMRALSSESNGLDGLNDILSILDELHAMNRQVFEVIVSGMFKRTDSLVLCITTAGFNVESVGHDQSEYAKKVSMGEHEDDFFFAAVFTLDKGDDIFEEKNWIKANPNWGVSVDANAFRAMVEKAKVSPADIPGLKVKHMNMWISEVNAFFDPEKWDACADPNLKIEDFKGEKCKHGLDLASHIDITSRAKVFRRDGIYYFFTDNYIPEKTVEESRIDLYDNAIARGDLIKTPGSVINNEKIQEEIIADSKIYNIDECLYDAWGATEMANKLANKIEMVKFSMNVANFSEPMKKFDSLMRDGKLRHNGNILNRWAVSNVVAKRDHNDNVFPRKSHVKLKIDPVIAMLMGLAAWLQEEEDGSVYEEHGVRFL